MHLELYILYCNILIIDDFLSGVYGLLLVLLFVILQAPDVALSMLVVSTVAYPLIVLIAISRTRRERGKE